jgi:hypothetical protein
MSIQPQMRIVLLNASCTKKGDHDASQKEIARSEIQQGGREERSQRNASEEARYSALWAQWQGRQSEKQEAGNCDRPI